MLKMYVWLHDNGAGSLSIGDTVFKFGMCFEITLFFENVAPHITIKIIYFYYYIFLKVIQPMIFFWFQS